MIFRLNRVIKVKRFLDNAENGYYVFSFNTVHFSTFPFPPRKLAAPNSIFLPLKTGLHQFKLLIQSRRIGEGAGGLTVLVFLCSLKTLPAIINDLYIKRNPFFPQSNDLKTKLHKRKNFKCAILVNIGILNGVTRFGPRTHRLGTKSRCCSNGELHLIFVRKIIVQLYINQTITAIVHASV